MTDMPLSTLGPGLNLPISGEEKWKYQPLASAIQTCPMESSRTLFPLFRTFALADDLKAFPSRVQACLKAAA